MSAENTETRDALLPTPRATDGTKGGPNHDLAKEVAA